MNSNMILSGGVLSASLHCRLQKYNHTRPAPSCPSQQHQLPSSNSPDPRVRAITPLSPFSSSSSRSDSTADTSHSVLRYDTRKRRCISPSELGSTLVSATSARISYHPGSIWMVTSYMVTRHQMQAFFSLLDDGVISVFLERDVCYQYADNYLLAMVFTYFVRAGFSVHQYTRINFFVALFLAHDLCEDEEDYKYEIFPWMYGEWQWRQRVSTLHQRRDTLCRSLQYRCVVSRRCCEQVMSISSGHRVWQRCRAEHHGGALRECHTAAQWSGPYGPSRIAPRCHLCLSAD